MTIPLLFLSDNPLGVTGLGRITKALADRTHGHLSDIYRVGVAGIGPQFNTSNPYPIYPMSQAWGEPLPAVWKDFAGDEPGILFSVMNAAWLRDFIYPNEHVSVDLRAFWKSKSIKKWIYAPIDGEGVNEKLPSNESCVLDRMDRVLTYTKWAASKIDQSICGGVPVTQSLPHGTDSSVFYPRARVNSRSNQFCLRVLKKKGSLDPFTLLIGCIATNTSRKDWPLCFEACQELIKRGVDVGLWLNTNAAIGYWDLVTMAKEFGMQDRVLFTFGNLSDEDMAWGYAACNVTLGIGSGEGWGMPLSESLACGVPVVTGDYAGVTEFVPQELRVDPWAWRYDGFYCNRRPVYRAEDWADRIQWAAGKHFVLPAKFTWDGCWPAWEVWLRKGATL